MGTTDLLQREGLGGGSWALDSERPTQFPAQPLTSTEDLGRLGKFPILRSISFFICGIGHCGEGDLKYARGLAGSESLMHSGCSSKPWLQREVLLSLSCYSNQKQCTQSSLIGKKCFKDFLLDQGIVFHEINRWFGSIIQWSQQNWPHPSYSELKSNP